ncbi:zinc ion binding protein-like protein [Xylogone sp. PMI_703]|nr:zinc ion binding protein-like protein [Xylogone sp. PMI_703]
MPEIDALISEYSHHKHRPREKDALHSLKKIASLVKPIMRARGWRVGTLAEFYPEQRNLLGINENKGQRICLRLRYPSDQNQFLPLEQVVDTMLHELCHIVHGPHNKEFHALWDQLRKEYEGLLSKGYTGEGFLSDGHKLGGRRIPMDEARRLARVAAEKRKVRHAGSGQRLGGAPIRAGTDIREVIVQAVERRNTVLKGCGAESKNEKEIKDLADQATHNGFRTKAEEDEANDRAIAQALWELVQEDEKREYGDSYVPATPANPTGSAGGKLNKGPEPSTKRAASTPSSPPPPTSVAPAPPLAAITEWECPTCTLENPVNYLCCDVCTAERPPEVSRKIAEATLALEKTPANTWECRYCTTIMEDKWWTCSSCGKMKESS